MHSVRLRLYAELNDFLPPQRRQRDLEVPLPLGATVKALIEQLGVPHTEVDLVLANGKSVDFSWRPRAGDRLSVYPVFESWDVSAITRVRPEPLRKVRFLLDVHLGRLARQLRMLGLDAAWQAHRDDGELAAEAASEGRILLTRDRGLLKRRAVSHGYWVRAASADAQLAEVVVRFDLRGSARPFSRCIACNGLLAPAAPGDAHGRVPAFVERTERAFSRCLDCGKLYWRGTHWKRMAETVERILGTG
jgi:uncharacterized protein with PIN domain